MERGLEVQVPQDSSQAVIDEMIVAELVHGDLSSESKVRRLEIVEHLAELVLAGPDAAVMLI